MKTFKAKLLKDLTYINGCKLKKGSIVKVAQSSSRSSWVVNVRSIQLIKVFNYDFEVV